MFVTVTAKTLNPTPLRGRPLAHESSESVLLKAGADRVITPNVIGGRRMANLVLHPFVSDYLDLVTHGDDVEFRLQDFELPADVADRRASASGSRVVRDRFGASSSPCVDAGRLLDTNPSMRRVLVPGTVWSCSARLSSSTRSCRRGLSVSWRLELENNGYACIARQRTGGTRVDLAAYIRDIPDFPQEGIVFKDITPLLADAEAFREAVDTIAEQYSRSRRHEGRGRRGPRLHLRRRARLQLGAGFVPARKPGKLPWNTTAPSTTSSTAPTRSRCTPTLWARGCRPDRRRRAGHRRDRRRQGAARDEHRRRGRRLRVPHRARLPQRPGEAARGREDRLAHPRRVARDAEHLASACYGADVVAGTAARRTPRRSSLDAREAEGPRGRLATGRDRGPRRRPAVVHDDDDPACPPRLSAIRVPKGSVREAHVRSSCCRSVPKRSAASVELVSVPGAAPR